MMARPTDIANDGTVARECEVKNKLGIHARPAAMFVKIASQFECEILVEKDGETVNGKSIMGLMMLAAGPGSRLNLQAKGKDAGKAVNELSDLIARNFEES